MINLNHIDKLDCPKTIMVNVLVLYLKNLREWRCSRYMANLEKSRIIIITSILSLSEGYTSSMVKTKCEKEKKVNLSINGLARTQQ